MWVREQGEEEGGGEGEGEGEGGEKEEYLASYTATGLHVTLMTQEQSDKAPCLSRKGNVRVRLPCLCW